MAKPPMKKKGASPDKKMKKKMSILTAEKVTWVDYKDVNLLRRFMSERAKIRARRVNGNDQQQQAAVARAIKISREMALLPYSVRQTQQRSKGKGRDRGDRGERGERDLELDTGIVEETGAEEFEGVEDAVETELAEVEAGGDD